MNAENKPLAIKPNKSNDFATLAADPATLANDAAEAPVFIPAAVFAAAFAATPLLPAALIVSSANPPFKRVNLPVEASLEKANGLFCKSLKSVLAASDLVPKPFPAPCALIKSIVRPVLPVALPTTLPTVLDKAVCGISFPTLPIFPTGNAAIRLAKTSLRALNARAPLPKASVVPINVSLCSSLASAYVKVAVVNAASAAAAKSSLELNKLTDGLILLISPANPLKEDGPPFLPPINLEELLSRFEPGWPKTVCPGPPRKS